MCFVGDFSQLRPPFDTPLYLPPKPGARRWYQNQSATAWQQITYCTILTRQMRQCAEKDKEWVALLNRLAEGRCTDEDYRRTQRHVIGKSPEAKLKLASGRFQDAPIVTTTHLSRMAMNYDYTLAFARAHRRRVYMVLAEDTVKGYAPLQQMRYNLLNKVEGKTGFPGKLYLVEGLPIILKYDGC